MILLLSIAAISTARRAHAQSAEAEGMFREGDRLMAAGQIGQACDAFDASNRLEQRAGTLIRLGECREKNHQLASAWSAYNDALTRVRDPRKRDIAKAKAAELESKLSYLTILVPDESRIEGLVVTRNGKPVDALLWNRSVPVDGGTYVIAAHAPGHDPWQTPPVVVPEASGKVSVEVPKFKDLAQLLTPPTPANAAAPRSGGEEPDSDEDHRTASAFTGRRKLALGIAGGALVGAGVGVVLALRSQSQQRDADMLCPDPSSCGNADRAHDLNLSAHRAAIGADVAFGVGGALAITAGLLWITGAPSHSRIAVVPTRSGFGLAGSF